MANVIQPGSAPASAHMITATDGAIVALMMAGSAWLGSVFIHPAPKVEVREVTKIEYVLKPVLTPMCTLEDHATSRDGPNGATMVREGNVAPMVKSQREAWRDYDRENARREAEARRLEREERRLNGRR